MERELNPHIMFGVVAKAATYGALLLAGGPAVTATTAGMFAASAVAEGVGATIEGIESRRGLKERLTDAMMDALDESFNASANRTDAPCAFGTSVREAVRSGLLGGAGKAVVEAGADGTTALFELVSQACERCPSIDASAEAKRWLVNDFFERLSEKMLSDELMCTFVVYQTLLYGLSNTFLKLHDMDARLESLESAQEAIVSAYGPNGAVAALVKGLEFRLSEGIPILGDEAESEDARKRFQGMLEAAIEEAMAKSGRASTPSTPRNMTSIPSRGTLVGRDSELEQVDALLETNSLVIVRAHGGVGKTSLTAALVDGHCRAHGRDGGGEYSHFAWIESSGSLASDLARINIAVGQPELSPDRRTKAALDWLTTTKEKTLLAIDGMDVPPSDEDRGILNSLPPEVRVIVTSRADLKMGQVYELEPIDQDLATRIFYAYFLDKREAPTLDELEARSDCPTAKDIIRHCKGNALLIELIAKAARSEGGRLEDYWKECGERVFRGEAANLETEHARSRGEGTDTLRAQVSRLYALARLTTPQEHAMALLVQFPSGVPIYYKMRDWAGISQDDMNWLVRLGWVERGEGNYSVHQVVRESVLLQLEAGRTIVNPLDYGDLVKRALDAESYLSKSERYEDFAKRIVIPETLARLLSTVDGNDARLAELRLCVATGCCYFDRGDYSKALEFGNRLISTPERLPDEGHLVVADAHDLLLRTSLAKGDFNLLQEYLKMASPALEAMQDPRYAYPTLVDTMKAYLCEWQGDYEQARKHRAEAAKGLEDAWGLAHPYTLRAYACLATSCAALGDDKQAWAYIGKVREVLEGADDMSEQGRALTYESLSIACWSAGDMELARTCLEREVEGFETAFGADHPDAAGARLDLGMWYIAIGDFASARSHLVDALGPLEDKLGINDPLTARAHDCLGIACRKLGYYEEARNHFKKAAEALEITFGMDYDETISSYQSLATTCFILGKFEKARDYLMRVVRPLENKRVADFPNSLVIEEDLLNILIVDDDQGGHNLVRTILGVLDGTCDMLTIGDIVGGQQNNGLPWRCIGPQA